MTSIVFTEIEQSLNDKRQYRLVRLQNELEVLLCHDPDTQKSSAACDVRVGSLCDPEEAPGLAHFLEHMLFLGTEKYPVENAYSAFLNAHAGGSNAYTSQENTVYYFDIQNDHFEEAINMFASFFICPLFNDSSTTREINAVDNENTKNLQSDQWRLFQLMKSMSRSDHPFNKFSTGNSETLEKMPLERGINIRDLLLSFYDKHYSANLMKFVLYGKESLDTLQGWAEEKLSSIMNKNLSRVAVPSDPYRPEQLQKYLEVLPVKDIKSLDLYFPMPEVQSLYLSKPTRYLSHLVGHESSGSILAALKSRGYANGLAAFMSQSCTDFACFGISIELTDMGINKTDDIIECIFSYIGMLRREGPQEWVAKEVKDIAEMNFRFVSKTEPSSYAVALANNMQIYAKEKIVSGNSLVFETDLSLTARLIEYLNPRNCLVILQHKGLQKLPQGLESQERWYGTKYNEKKMAEADQLARWEEALYSGSSTAGWIPLLSLPEPNMFIPTDFTLRSEGIPVAPPDDEAVLRRAPQLIEKIEVNAPLPDFDLAAESTEEGDGEEKAVGQQEGDQKNAPSDSAPSEEEEQTAPGADANENSGAAEDAEGEGDEDGAVEGEEEGGGEEVAVGPLPGRAMTVWFLQDAVWRIPKINVLIKIETIQAYTSPLNVALTDVFANVLEEHLTEFSYYADCAGLHYSVQNVRSGLELSFNGYSHKLPALVTKALEMMKNISSGGTGAVSRAGEVFSRMKEKILRTYKNFAFSQPYMHCIVGTMNCLEDPRWTSAEKLSALKPVVLEEFHAFSSALLRQIHCELLVHGNATATEAKESITRAISETLESLPLPYGEEPIRRVVSLRAGETYVYRQHAGETNPQERNSAVEDAYLISEDISIADFPEEEAAEGVSTELAAVKEGEIHLDGVSEVGSGDDGDWVGLKAASILSLVSHMLSEPAFDQLRTKEQLGYIVHVASFKVGNVLGLRIIVQSNHKDAQYLDNRIEDFLQSYRATLEEMSEESLADYIKAVIENLSERPKSLDKESSAHWPEINNSTYLFSRKRLMANYLRTRAHKQDVLKFFDRFLGSSSPFRVKFSSQFFGAGKRPSARAPPASSPVTIIRNPVLFKRSMPLLPVRNNVDFLKVVKDDV